MLPRTEIIDNRIVNSVEQLASFLKTGDIFRKPRGKTQYKFIALQLDANTVLCENLDTHQQEEIYFNSPVFKLVFV
jgi:hypothetical protein